MICYHLIVSCIPLKSCFWLVVLLSATSDFKVRFLWSPLSVAEWPVKMALLPESIGKGICEMNTNDGYEFVSRCNSHGTSLEENWKLIHADGDVRTLKSHRGVHLFCQKANLPAGVAYQESCSPFIRYRCSRATGTSESKAPEADVSPWDSKATTTVFLQTPKQCCAYKDFCCAPRESCSFLCGENEDKCLLPSLLCNDVVMLATWRCSYVLTCECQDKRVARCLLFKLCSVASNGPCQEDLKKVV